MGYHASEAIGMMTHCQHAIARANPMAAATGAATMSASANFMVLIHPVGVLRYINHISMYRVVNQYPTGTLMAGADFFATRFGEMIIAISSH